MLKISGLESIGGNTCSTKPRRSWRVAGGWRIKKFHQRLVLKKIV